MMVEPSGQQRPRADSFGNEQEAPAHHRDPNKAAFNSINNAPTESYQHQGELYGDETCPSSPFRQSKLVKMKNQSVEDEARDNYGEAEDEYDDPTTNTSSRSYSYSEDPYVYSDDSASLSDAYFCPQPSDHHYQHEPPQQDGLWTQAALMQHDQHHQQHLLYPLGHPYYNAAAVEQAIHYHRPFAGAAIQEDSDQIVNQNSATEASMLLQPPAEQQQSQPPTIPRIKRKHRGGSRRSHNNSNPSTGRHHHRSGRKGSARQRKDSLRKYTFWAILFLLHFLTILALAIRFGYKLLFTKPPSGYHFWNVPWYEDDSSNSNGREIDATGSSHGGNSTTTTSPHHHPAGGDFGAAVYSFSTFTIDYQNAMALVSITLFYSCVVVYVSFGFMLLLARALIQIMLIVSVILALGWGLVGLAVDPYGIISVSGFAALLLALGYAMYNWRRIPFAATNLFTALSALRSTADITIVSLVSLVISCVWCMIWGIAFIGIVNSLNRVECKHKEECEAHVASHHIPIILLMFLSFHWTNTVIKNVTRVTIASVVATWWYYPGDVGTFCSPAVLRPLLLAITKQFGAICFGSLVSQPAQYLMVFGRCCCCVLGNPDSGCRAAQPGGCYSSRSQANKDDGGLAAPHDDEDDGAESPVDSVGLFRRLFVLNDRLSAYLRSCNRWAYTYIGMYGYGFVEAGERAIHLFETRTWLNVVKDGLIHNVLVMASVVIGGSVGIFAVVVEETDGFELSSFHKPVVSAFGIGCILGYVLSNILLLGVIGSAVNTVLVCFASGPFEFDKNHPQLSREMREMWSQQVWEPTVLV